MIKKLKFMIISSDLGKQLESKISKKCRKKKQTSNFTSFRNIILQHGKKITFNPNGRIK